MGRWSAKIREPTAVATLSVVLTALLAVLTIRFTGGVESAYEPVIFLPIIIAIAACNFETVVAVSVCVTFFDLIWAHPDGAGAIGATTAAARALTINVVAVAGGIFTMRLQKERDLWRHTVAAKEALLNASHAVNSADSLEAALDSTLLMLRTLMPRSQHAAIFLSDQTQQSMKLVALLGVAAADLKFERYTPRSRRLGWHPSSPRALHVPDTHAVPHLRLASLVPGARSVVCVGLRALKVPIGMLFVSSVSPHAFAPDQVELLEELADRIGFSLHKIRLQEGLHDLAYSDGMTGLCNYRAFRAHLTEEIKRSARYRRRLSLVMLDLDDFKRINDGFGHPAGNNVLVGVAATIRLTLRETDVAARYGGEEFAVICPESGDRQASILAERIRRAVEDATYEVGPGETASVTISAGVATFPLHAADDTQLIAAADAALYEAKLHGKNRVETARPSAAGTPREA